MGAGVPGIGGGTRRDAGRCRRAGVRIAYDCPTHGLVSIADPFERYGDELA